MAKKTTTILRQLQAEDLQLVPQLNEMIGVSKGIRTFVIASITLKRK